MENQTKFLCSGQDFGFGDSQEKNRFQFSASTEITQGSYHLVSQFESLQNVCV